MKRWLLILALALSGLLPLGADVPVRHEEFIYSILGFNGLDYSGTFSREAADAIYVIAGVNNFLSARKTFVYFWPITGDWKTDSSALNEEFQGSLELKDRSGKIQVLKSIPYTYYNIRGEYELNWKVAQEEEADRAWKHYQDLIDGYYKAVSEYQKAGLAYELMLNELAKRIGELRKQGRDVSRLLEQLKALKAPAQPEFPKEYIVPPAPIARAFILNLPVGTYSIRFLNEDGTVMERSEKKVIAFARRRSNGVGFEIIPADKWTRTVDSKAPGSVIYVNGATHLYLRPFFQDEFNDLYYEKMKRNDARGNPNLMKWVRIQQVPKAQVELIRRRGEAAVVLENPFYVEQTKGSSLGYTIVPFDPQGAHKDREPSLFAFHIPVDAKERVIRLAAKDKNGTLLAGSERQIRVVGKSSGQILALVLAFIFLVVMAVVLERRRRTYTP